MAESINGTNGVPYLEENAFPALELAPEKIIEDVPSVSSNDNHTPEAPKELSAAEKLMQQHELAAQQGEIVTRIDARVEEPSPPGLAAAPTPEKRAGKQKESAPIVSRGLDISSAEAFPSLGGSTKAVSAVAWGAKMTVPPVNGSNDSPEVNTRALAPAVVGSSGQQIVELSPAQKKPLSELRKAAVEIVKEIMKKTSTKIDMAQTMTKTTVFIVNGTEVNRQRARREIFRELSLKVFRTFVLSLFYGCNSFAYGTDSFRLKSLDIYYNPNPCHCETAHHWKRWFEGSRA